MSNPYLQQAPKRTYTAAGMPPNPDAQPPPYKMPRPSSYGNGGTNPYGRPPSQQPPRPNPYSNTRGGGGGGGYGQPHQQQQQPPPLGHYGSRAPPMQSMQPMKGRPE